MYSLSIVHVTVHNRQMYIYEMECFTQNVLSGMGNGHQKYYMSEL